MPRFIFTAVLLIAVVGSALAQDVNELIERAQEAYERGDLQEAESAYTDAIAADTSLQEGEAGADLHYNRGTVRLEQERYSSAISDFDEVLSRSEVSAELSQRARYNLGLALMGEERYSDAIESFTRLMDLMESADAGASAAVHSAVLVNRGIARYMSRDGAQDALLSEARADFEAALEIDPANARAHYNLGNLAFDEEDYETAIQHYSAAIESRTGYVNALLNRARARIAAEQYESAASDLDEVLQLEPDNSEAGQLLQAVDGQEN